MSSHGNLKQILKNKKLTVLTTNSNTTFYYGKDSVTGFEYDLIRAFGNYLGVEVNIKVNNSISGILENMRKNKADIAAAGLTRTPEREKYFLFGPDYIETKQYLVTHRDNSLNSLNELSKEDIVIVQGSSHSEKLMELKRVNPLIEWTETDEYSIEQILEKVEQKEIYCTIADENVISINQRYYPHLKPVLAVSNKEHFSWIVASRGSELQKELYTWFEEFKKSDELEQLYNKYYGHIDIFDYVDISIFHRRIESVLPDLKDYFLEAEEKYDVNWKLLAAIAYQESHWKKYAKSPTGVRGIMMLTQRTAQELGVTNRLDLKQSIFGGARYYLNLLNRIPESVHNDSRDKFALAAYNIGMGHIYDARTLARRLSINPDSWGSLKTVLPLLSQKKYYRTLKYGYARGMEPVHYVEKILNYKEILENKHSSYLDSTVAVTFINEN